jgi:hypothetical protein
VEVRPDAAAVTDEGELALHDVLGHGRLGVGAEAGARSVEGAVAQGQALGPVDAGHGVLDVPDGVERRPQLGRRIGVERVVLGLDRTPGAGVRPAGVALGDEPADADGPARGQQVVGALGAQAVGHGEELVGVLHVHVTAEGGELVDDDLGFGLGHGPGHRVGVEGVGHHGTGAQGPDGVGLARRAGHAHDVVTSGIELGDELGAECASGTGDEHLHVCLLLSVHL